MQVVNMKAERRTALGRNQVKQLRAKGWLPAVVYGEGKEAISISISEWELEQHVKAHHKVFQLDIGGASQSALLQEISWQATTDRPLHVDFKRVDLTKAIETEVEVELVGHPIGLGKGGQLHKDHLVVEIRCLPTNIPASILVDIGALDMDQEISAGQLEMPAGVELLTPKDTTICHVAEAVAVEAAAPAAEAPEAGATPAAEGDKDKKEGGTPPAKA